MTDATNLRDTIAPKSDRVNADDFLAGPETVTITAVKRGDADTPVAIHIEGRKPYYPCKSMRRVLISAWGDNMAPEAAPGAAALNWESPPKLASWFCRLKSCP